MFLLPKFIYICRAIPYLIPAPLLNKLQSLLLKYICNNKKLRINKSLLHQPSQTGGFGVLNIAAYNKAAILDQSSILWHSHPVQRWAQLEDTSVPFVTCRDILVSLYLENNPPTVVLLSLSHLFKVWQLCVVQKCWLFVEYSEIPFSGFKCCSLDHCWPSWDEYGVHHLAHIYVNETLNSFEDIVGTFTIPRTAFFQYLQIRHSLHSICWPT